ncbi:MAG: Ski complex subunit Rec14 [Ramalina farinacea]|uniref:Ski complex subunit Rec14 n=1 Tax=Ramalina farinacea TaxID=258253 RepID=A0AA43QIQ0_9LECA|nr:Ski complex subunit Rec14 [Ramalina farinacea]
MVDGNKAGEVWAIVLSEDGQYLAATSFDGRINVWDNLADGAKIKEFETKGSFGMSMVKSVRSVKFSPGGTLLAATGDSTLIALYDVGSGEQVANLRGHTSWVFSLDWSHTGEFLLSGSFDGKAKVWSIDRRECVATHSETDKTLWSVKWLPKTGKSEGFATGGANKSICFYREASGG